MILIDDRSGSSDLARCPILEGRYTLSRLDNDRGEAVGDAMLTGHGPNGSTITVGVEMKKMSDLLTSISTGRLGGTQLPRMMKEYDHVWILYYGGYRPNPVSNVLQILKGRLWKTYRVGRREVPWAYVEGALLTYEMLGCVHSKHVHDINEAAAWLVVLDHWLEKEWDRHRGLAVFDKSREVVAPPDADPAEELMARIAAQLPAVDWMRGWAAARHFDSVIQMVCADREDWRGVPGIGKVIADSVWRALNRRKDKEEK